MKIWLAKSLIRGYADPTEPTKYPDLYQQFAPVLPDQITISREELLQAFGWAYSTPENQHKILDSEVCIAATERLFASDAKGG